VYLQSICPGQYFLGNRSVNSLTFIPFGVQDNFEFLSPVSGKVLLCRLPAAFSCEYL
jgi:hypothetical protein